MNPLVPIGKVILAGAGPGDPDLISVKAANCLQQADIVLTDRLVSKEIITRYVKPFATIIEVGKQCRRGVSTPQLTINEMIVQYAKQGKYIVRLKGGDVAFYSNVFDELETLVANQIPYEIVPGITAASGASAYAGIPLTARDHATAVRFLTYYQSTVVKDDYWKELAKTEDTLVFYMSSETLDELVNKLIENGIAADAQLAVIEQASTPFQQVYISKVHAYVNTLKGQSFLSPSLVIIGKVVNLHASFNWFTGSDAKQYYFQPLTAQVETMVKNDTNKRHVSRA